jgi:hypothetical protein
MSDNGRIDGASLFYTTQDPDTLSILRQHTLHLLFMPSPPSSSENAVGRNMFPFTQKPNALDRDQIRIPAGWDTWGKIGVLRGGFDCRGWGDAWEYDLDSKESENPSGAKVMYKKLVGSDDRIKVSPSCRLQMSLKWIRNLVYRNLYFLFPSKHSSRSIGMRMPNEPTRIPGTASRIPMRVGLLALSALWEA